MYVSLNLYDKASALNNKLQVFDIDNVTDDVISIEDKFIKNEVYTKRDKTKKACITEIAGIPMSEEYVNDIFMRNKNCQYPAVLYIYLNCLRNVGK